MSRIQINLDHAHSVSGDLIHKVSRLPNVKSNLSSMVYQVDSQIAGRRNIRSRLNRVSHSTQELEMRLRDLKVFIDSSLDKYRRTEALLVQMSLGIAGIQTISYYGSNGIASTNGVPLAYDFIGPPVYKDGTMNSCPAPTPEPKLNPFIKAWKSIQGIGSDLYDAAENRADHAGDSVPAFLDYLTMGIPSGAYKAAEDRANRMMDSPFDFVNWATLGISGMADEALLPDDPLSKEHLSSSFGLASLLAGGTLAASGRPSFPMRTSKDDTGSSSVEGTGKIEVTKPLQQLVDEIRAELPSSIKKSGNIGVAKIEINGLPNELKAHSSVNFATDKGSDGFVLLKSKEHRNFNTINVDKDGYVGTEKAYSREWDTEVKILEDVASRLGANTLAKGTIDLFTERLACASCSDVILEFRRKYPNIQLNVHTGNK